MDQATREALDEALDDEYKARATYRAVLDRFGDMRPFVNIVEAEGRHVRALHRIYERYGLQPPPDRWRGRVPAPQSVETACRAAAQAERENEAMYARILPQVEDPEIRDVMERLRSASLDRHLPAFERCIARGGRGGGRRGRADEPCRGRGRGRGCQGQR